MTTTTTHDWLRSLVGKTFERDGKQRQITRVEGGNIYWSRPGGNEQKRPIWLSEFKEWLKKAREV